MSRAPAAFARLLAQGVSLAVLRRPRTPLALPGFGSFALAWALAVAAYAGIDFVRTPLPRAFDPPGLLMQAGIGLGLLLAAWCAVRLLRRPAALFALAALAAIALLPWLTLRDFAADGALALVPRRWDPWLDHLAWATLAAVSLRLVWVLGTDAPRSRRVLAWLAFALVLWPVAHERTEAYVWYTAADPEASDPESDDEDTSPESPARPDTAQSRAAERATDPETLLGRQPALVTSTLAALAPQRPGHVDLYGVGFAGDGTEPPFRNEVAYFTQLLAARFDAAGHVVALDNSPAAPTDVPLATVANLRATLAGIGARMDAGEDVLFLYLTTHGSPDHWLLVQRPPLPLRQVRPEDLRDALDDAGIRWRVIVVSACYSGGFIDALRDPRTLVITAARADRPSFGCGAKSEITWFGDEFLVGALNRTLDFRAAYDIADRGVRARELEQQAKPSAPQLWVGTGIEAKIAQWRAGVPPAPPVPFVAVLPVHDDAGSDAHATGASH